MVQTGRVQEVSSRRMSGRSWTEDFDWHGCFVGIKGIRQDKGREASGGIAWHLWYSSGAGGWLRDAGNGLVQAVDVFYWG
jgi:hypothetical protein